MFRPAGLSDEDSYSDDDYGYYDKPRNNYKYRINHENLKKKTENRLQDSIINGNLKEVEKIIALDLNNDANIKLDSGWTALMHACFHAQKKIVQLLLDKGADPNLHADSVTPVMAACSNSSASEDIIHDIVSSLIEHNCLLNIGDRYGQTPLMRAVSSGRASVVELILSKNVNIEMRDRQGWTAVFWAAHHNQPKILEILISKGARFSEVDMSGRTVMDIAQSHEYPQIIEILNQYLKCKNDTDKQLDGNDITDLASWQDYYPGLNGDQRPNYANEIRHLLYGMNCERLTSTIMQNNMDLRTFLLLEEDDMIKLGIDMPFERQRLKHGLRSFHKKSWKLNAVAGLHIQKNDYSTQDCLATLGSHLQQLYILEATLQYVLRDYCKIQNQMKFEPPDSPVISKMQAAAKKVLTNINNIRREIKLMKAMNEKISKNNPRPADLITEKSTKEVVLGYLTDGVVICSLALLLYHSRTYITGLLRK